MTEPPISDEQLLEAYQSGDQQAFITLMRRYEKPLFNFLVRFTGKSSWAEDVFQDTFLQVHLSADSFETSRRFRPWLYTIAANKARDMMRRQARRPAVQLTGTEDGDGADVSLWDVLLRDDETPDAVLDRKLEQERVREVVAEMPDNLREILLLAYFQQLPYKEIAESLGIPLGTVKSRLHSAVALFAKRYGRETP